MEKQIKDLAYRITTAILAIITQFVVGAIATLCYSTIAYEFNLPPLNFWVITGICYVLSKTFKK